MVGVLELMKFPRFFLIALIMLAGCSSSGRNDILSMAVSDLSKWRETAQGSNPAETITREQIEKLGVAMLRVQGNQAPSKNLLVALRKSGRQVTYVLRSGRRLILHGGLIQSTQGFGDNLEPVSVGRNDPVAFPRRVADWPERIKRGYTLSGRGPGFETAVSCSFSSRGSEVIEIMNEKVLVQTIIEACSGGEYAFENLYNVDPQTGFIWRSAQWTGPAQGMLVYEVLEPLD